VYKNRSSLRAAFFLLYSFCFSVFFIENAFGKPFNEVGLEKADLKHISESPTWSALLHFSENKLQIRDGEFIASVDNFSLEDELKLSIAQFSGENRQTSACRYPARYLWLHTQLNIPEIDLNKCDEFVEYINRVPTDAISIVFASENINQPSSMMGHIFVKLEGLDSEGKYRKHAISFYTDANTLNVPKLLVQNIITGMPGYYSLAPYDEALQQYSAKESRTVWEYRIKLDGFRLKLLQYHLYELRYAKLKYYFHRYNCASLIKDLLVLVAPSAPPSGELWVTPKDVIKFASDVDLIEDVSVVPSTQWVLRSLMEKLTDKEIDDIISVLNGDDYSTGPIYLKGEKGYVASEFSRNYSNLQYQQKKISTSQWEEQMAFLRTQMVVAGGGYAIETSHMINPVNSPGDSQVTVGEIVRGTDRYVRYSILPASHALLDKQPAIFGDSELKLFEIIALHSLNSGELTIDQFTLYSTKSLLPWDKVNGGLSGGMRIAYEQQFDHTLTSKHSMNVAGEVGFTIGLGRDVSLFALGGGGIGFDTAMTYVQANSSVGATIREMADMKTMIYAGITLNPLGNSGNTSNFGVNHQVNLSKRHAINLSWQYIRSDLSSVHVEETSLVYKYIF
jgi:Domain of unknown function (DUF4105)